MAEAGAPAPGTVDPSAEEAIPEPKRCAMNIDEHQVRQQRHYAPRIEMLSSRQSFRRVDGLPVSEERPRAVMQAGGIDGRVLSNPGSDRMVPKVLTPLG